VRNITWCYNSVCTRDSLFLHDETFKILTFLFFCKMKRWSKAQAPKRRERREDNGALRIAIKIVIAVRNTT